jgi:transposase
MGQLLLPLFCEGATEINEVMSYQKRDGMVYYFHAGLPVFVHAEGDVRSFRMFTSQLYVSGNCTQSEIVRAFGVSVISVKRWAKRYREEGAGGFFKRPAARRPAVLTEEVLQKAQRRLAEGEERGAVAEVLGIKPDTLYRAIRSGRLVEGKKKLPTSR